MHIDYEHVTNPMTMEQKKVWLEALRSGQYKQGHEYLEIFQDNEMTYCCLGVAKVVCKLTIENDKLLCTNTYDDSVFLPREIQVKLAKMNDGAIAYGGEPAQTRLNFSEIADYIEKEIPAYDEVNNASA